MPEQSFDESVWQHIHASLTNKRGKRVGEKPDDSSLDYKDLEEQVEDLWQVLEDRKYHTVRDECQNILEAIEKDLADDFGQNLHVTTLYEDPYKLRRKIYLEALKLYKQALQSLVLELIIETEEHSDIGRNFESYQSLRNGIHVEISKVAYILGRNYESETFITPADLDSLDKLMREHCQFLLKQEFFHKFKLVIQALGRLDRKDFHKVTEPYKNLRKSCEQCLDLLAVMKDGRFFGEEDTFIEDYEKDVKIYLQILWYLAIKTDLNKIDKFLDPNTYSQGLDAHCQVFAALSLLVQILPHLEKARDTGLIDNAVTEILEEYAEYLYKIITHEEDQLDKEELQQLRETDRILADGYSTEFYKEVDLSPPEDAPEDFEKSYCAVDDLKQTYGEKIRNEAEGYISQEDTREFEVLLEKSALGVGIREKSLAEEESSDEKKKARKIYRYKYHRGGARDSVPAVVVMERGFDKKREIKLLHKGWAGQLYDAWRKIKKLQYMKGIIEQHTKTQQKTKYRMDFAVKFFKKRFFAFRLGEHKRIAVPNPEGRVLRQDTSVDQALASLKASIFLTFFKELKMQYRSRNGLKMQRLRWGWFAERELKEEYFKKPKYNYLKYIHTRWKEKVKNHYKTLQRFSKRETDNKEF